MVKPVCAIVGIGPKNGAAFARRFDKAGYRVALLSRSTDFSAELATELNDARAYGCDASDPVSVNAAFAKLQQQMGEVDVLIYNEARSLPRMLYSPDQWQLILVGHQKAFSRSTGRPRYLESVSIELGPAWMEALIGLSAEALEEQLGDVLDKRRREALLERRDEMVYAVEQTGTSG